MEAQTDMMEHNHARASSAVACSRDGAELRCALWLVARPSEGNASER